jgi:Uma2 family endonuclease
MATTTLITAKQYLDMYFEEHPPELVDGELVERSMPTPLHSRLHYLLGLRLNGAGVCLIAVRVRVSPQVMRIPDLAVYREFPAEPIPKSPPFIIVEVTSPDDRHEDLLRKLGQYCAWGVKHIWVVEPELQDFHIYRDNGLVGVDRFELPEFGFRVTAQELFAEANAR